MLEEKKKMKEEKNLYAEAHSQGISMTMKPVIGLF